MVTGVETAGLVLSAFPLMVEGLKSYQQGINTISDMQKYELIIRQYHRELQVEAWKFKNTCRQLLEDIVSLKELQELMSEPGGLLWRQKDFTDSLQTRMDPTAILLFVRTIEDLKDDLQKLEGILGLSQNEMPKYLDKKTLKKRLKGVLLALSRPECKEISEKICRMNKDLADLTGKSTSSLRPATTLSGIHYQRIRSHAITLYEILKRELHVHKVCACPGSHSAHLQLEVRGTPIKKTVQKEGLRFAVVLSVDKTTKEPLEWKSFEFEPIECGEEVLVVPNVPQITKENCKFAGNNITISQPAESSKSGFLKSIKERSYSNASRFISLNRSPSPNLPNTNAKNTLPKTSRASFSSTHEDTLTPPPAPQPPAEVVEITNLCETLHAPSSCTKTCLGILRHQSSVSEERCRVWPCITPAPTITSTLSLADILDPKSPYERLKRRDSLALGVRLASTVLQLHDTHWLHKLWSAEDIIFPCESSAPLLNRAFVRRNFSSTASPPASKATVYAVDDSLFSLGIALVELWYDRRLPTELGYADAVRYIGPICDVAGYAYGGAVSRCLKGLDGDPNGVGLENEEVRKQVYSYIVLPLEETLVAFCGGRDQAGL